VEVTAPVESLRICSGQLQLGAFDLASAFDLPMSRAALILKRAPNQQSRAAQPDERIRMAERPQNKMIHQTGEHYICDRCRGLSTRFRLDTDRGYRDLVRQLQDFVDQGVLKIASANVPLSEILLSDVWPADDLIHVFACAQCRRTFKLSFSTYHRDKALWEALIPDPPPTVQ
jgi:hypothetical protein